MYDIAAIISGGTSTELRLKANWPVDWFGGSIEIQRRLLPGETFEPLTEPVQSIEINVNRANWPNLRVRDRVMVRLFFPGEDAKTLRKNTSRST